MYLTLSSSVELNHSLSQREGQREITRKHMIDVSTVSLSLPFYHHTSLFYTYMFVSIPITFLQLQSLYHSSYPSPFSSLSFLLSPSLSACLSPTIYSFSHILPPPVSHDISSIYLSHGPLHHKFIYSNYFKRHSKFISHLLIASVKHMQPCGSHKSLGAMQTNYLL